MRKFLSVAALIGLLAAVLYAQEPARFERGINIIRRNLTVSTGTINSLTITGSTSQIQADTGDNLLLRTALLSNSVRLNSQTDSTTTSGDLIGFQSKPRAGVDGTFNIYGGQISASTSNGVDQTSGGSVIGLHVDTYIRGTTASTIAGDVRGMQIELTGDESGQKTVSGDLVGLRFRSYFPLNTLTGDAEAIRVEKAESGGTPWDAVLELTGAETGVWDDTDVDSGDTEAGYIKVIVNGNVRYIVLYSDAP